MVNCGDPSRVLCLDGHSFEPANRDDGGGVVTRERDPFTVEVIRNALTAIAEEMSLVIMRSARSPLLREA
ncbi:MAG: hydantoinase B/oxoprolinase family protein, partial [Rhizobiales bacterium]|nr:hydantoinase B/oxoprolinase family protein [Hyphomicrobiales bacterium]